MKQATLKFLAFAFLWCSVNAVYGQVSTFPYSEDFEAGAGAWLPGGTNSSWAVGAPTGPNEITYAASGANAYVTGLSSTYNTNEDSYIQALFDFSTLTSPTISAAVFRSSENSWDGAQLQSSIDGGTTWTTIGAVGDIDYWYTDGAVNGLADGLGWTGRASTNNGSDGWEIARHDLTGLAGQSSVLLRFHFGSDGSVVWDGFGVDDIEVYDLVCDAPNTILTSNATAQGFDVDATDPVPSTAYDIEIITSGSQRTGVATAAGVTLPYTWTGGAVTTEYEVYLLGDCGSAWSGPSARITTLATCPDPSALAVSNVSTTSADIAWTVGGSETLWDIEVVTGGTAPTGVPTTEDITTNPYTIPGLSPSSQYDVYLRADCDGAAGTDESEWIGPVSFNTLCVAIAAPYCEDFSTATPNPSNAYIADFGNCWSSGPDNGPQWETELGTGGNTNSTNTGPFFDNTTFGTAGGAYMFLETSSGTAGSAAELYSPLIDLSGVTTPVMKFYTHMFGATTGSLDVEVDDGTGFVNVLNLSGQQTAAQADAWTLQEVDLCAYVGAAQIQIRFTATRGTSFTGDVSLDDFCIEDAGACPDVTTITTSMITDVSSEISWNTFPSCLSATYNVNITDGTTSTDFPGQTSPFSATGLTSGTQYFVVITPECGGGAQGSNFWTLNCDPALQCNYTLTLYDFSDGVSADGWDPANFVQITTGNQVATYTIDPGTYSPPSTATTVVNIGACPGEILSAEYFGTPADDGEVWTLSGPNGFSYSATPANQPRLDIVACPTCPPAFNDAVAEVCADGVTLTWENAAVYDSSQIVFTYGGFPFSFNEFSGIIDAAGTAAGEFTYSGAGWGPGTTVAYDLITYCSGGEASQISGSFTADNCNCADKCEYLVIVDDNNASGFDTGWPSSYVEVLLDGVSVGQVGASASMDADTFSVKTCPGSAIDFNFVDTDTWDEDVDITIESSAAGGAIYTNPPFANFNDNSTNLLSETSCPTCANPTAGNCESATTSSIEFSWIDNAGATNFNVEIVPQGTPPTGTATAALTDTFYVATGLTSNTCYDLYIQADCASGGGIGVSDYIGPMTCCTQKDFCGADQFTDPAGPSAAYVPGVNETTIICPDVAGDVVSVAFTEFAAEDRGTTTTCWDNLFIYDGNAVGVNEISPADLGLGPNTDGSGVGFCWDIANQSGTGDLNCQTIVASDASGCLTFDWVTDASGVDTGWIADVTCGPAPTCPAVVDLSNTNATSDGADISWTTTIAPDYNLELVDITAGGVPTGVATQTAVGAPPYTFTGLSPENTYCVYVQGDCGAGDVSAWSLCETCFTTLATCPPPTGIAAANVTDMTADVSWIDGGGAVLDHADLEWGPQGFVPGTGTLVSPATSPVSLSGLSAETCYDVYIQDICVVGSDSSLVTGPFTFCTTPTPPPAPVGVTCTTPPGTSAVVFSEDFDDLANWTSTNVGGNSWQIATGGTTSGSTGPSGPFSSTGYVYYEASGSVAADTAWLDSNPIDLSLAVDDAELSFFMHAFGANLDTAKFDVFITADAGATYTNVFAWTGQFQTAEDLLYVPVGINLAAYLGQTIQVRLRITDVPGFTGDLAVDEMRLEACGVFCPAPGALTCASSTTTDITISWTDNGSSNLFDIELVPFGGVPTGTPTTEDVVGTSHTETGLTANTSYSFYVRADCGGDLSDWVNVTCATSKDYCGGDIFTDPAGPTANYVPGVDETTVICPDNAGDVVYVTFSVFEAEDRNNAVTCWDNLFIYEGNTVGVNELSPADLGLGPNTDNSGQGFCWDSAANAGTGDLASAGAIISSDPTGCLTFDWVTDASVNAAGWEATVVCAPPPNCDAPSDFACGTSTTTSVDVSWTDVAANSVDYELEIGLAGFAATGTPTVTGVAGSTYSHTGLTPDTCYDLYVRANCGMTDGASIWVGPITCCTAKDYCAGDLFTDDGGVGAPYTSGVAETTVICPDNAGDIVYVNFSVFEAEDRNNQTTCWDNLFIYDGTTVGVNEISPADLGLGPNADGSGVGFCWDSASGGGTGDLASAGDILSSDPSGCLTFDWITDGSGNAAGWEATVVCAPPPSCYTIVSGECGATTNSSITFEMTDTTSNSVGYELEVVLAGTAPTGVATQTTTSTSETISGLMADTCYDIYYRNDCGLADGFSNWSGPVTCCTLCDPVGLSCQDLEAGLPACWSQSEADDFDWTLDQNGTTSGGTGPSDDHTLGAGGGGSYYYIETSGGVAGNQAILNAGVYDIAGVNIPGVDFWYHMAGATIGTLDVEVNDGSGAGWVNVFSLSGAQQAGINDPWLRAIVDVSPFVTTGSFQLRFIGERGTSFTGDIAIDDICFIDVPPPPANDSLCHAELIVPGLGKDCTSGTAGTLFQATQDDEASTPAISFQCGAVGAHSDVWYKMEIPAGGRVMVDFPVMPGANMFTELYAGPDKASMTYLDLSCDAVHPKVYPPAGAAVADMLTPGDSLWIRVWDAGNNDLGPFEICVNDPVPANNTCDNAMAIDFTQFNGSIGYELADLGCSFGGPACVGTADEMVWFSFVAQDANDIIQAGVHPALTPGFPTGFDAVIEVFDACAGTSLGCFNNYPADQLERVMVGGLVPGNTYYYSVHHFGGGTLADASFHTTHKTYADGKLRAPWCGATNVSLDDVIQSERDDVNELYIFAPVQVPAYGFEFSQGGTVLATVDNMAVDGFYLNLGNVAGLQYGQTYDVRVRHQVKLHVNGALGNHWSDYGPICTITLGAAPVTQVQSAFCTGASDYFLSENILADPLTGATSYRFTFDDGVNAPIVYTSNNYSVQLYQVPGLQYATTYSVTVEALLAGGYTTPGPACSINMKVKPENIGILASDCNGTYTAPSSDFILADNVLGAEFWEFRFTPLGGGAAFSVIHPNLSLTLDGSITQFTAGPVTYDVDVRVFAGGVFGDYSAVCPLTVIYTPPPAAPMGETGGSAIKLGNTTDVTIYPNPNAGDNFVLALGNMDTEVQKVVVEIVDLAGKTVHTEQFANSGSDANRIITFDEPLATGMYFVNVYLNDERIVKKITVE